MRPRRSDVHSPPTVSLPPAMADKQQNSVRQGDVAPVNQQARYDNHSGDKARDRLRAKLASKEDLKEQYGEQTADAMVKMMLAAWNSPKWKQADEAAIKIRDNPELDASQKGYLMAKLIEWAASP